MLKPLLMTLALSTPALCFAKPGCEQRLVPPEALFERAIGLDAEISSLSQSLGATPPRKVAAELTRLRDRLSESVSLMEDSPRLVVSWLDDIELRLIRLRRICKNALEDGTPALRFYLDYPSLIEADVVYQTSIGSEVTIVPSVVDDLNSDEEMAKAALRAMDTGSIIRLTMNSKVIEMRVRSRRYGNYRIYGLVRDGIVYMKDLTAQHTRPNDIHRAIERVLRGN